jgi:hypothetical protein
LSNCRTPADVSFRSHSAAHSSSTWRSKRALLPPFFGWVMVPRHKVPVLA